MVKDYPKFIFSKPHNIKSEGPFIVGTSHPFLVCRICKTPIETDALVFKRQFNLSPGHDIFILLLNNSEYASTLEINKELDKLVIWSKRQIISGNISFK